LYFYCIGGTSTNTRSSREKIRRDLNKMMDETTSDSEGEVTGPTTRRAWSDWCSSKGKSSQSEEENNNSTQASTRSSVAAAAGK
jgi:[histone H3]-lysine79 N-trimethyltransferase